MQTPQQVKILLIDDHDIVLWALSSIISENILGAETHTAANFGQGVVLLQKHKMDLVVLDVDVPGGSGPQMIEILRKAHKQVRILVYTAMSEEDFSVKYLTAGADGFISKGAPFPTIIQALNTVLKGNKYMSLKTQNFLAENYLKSVTTPARVKRKIKVTAREAEIIPFLLAGKWTKEIAGELGIKWSTVSTHKLNILEKFGVSNVLELYKKIQKESPELLNGNVIKVSPNS